MIDLLSIVIKFFLLVGITYSLVLFFKRKKEVVPIEEIPKTKTRIILEIAGWVILSITTISYTAIYYPSTPLMFFVHSFWLTLLAFYVYDDSRKRYLNRFWNIGLSVAVFIFFPIIIFYLFNRPPIAFEITGTRFRKKIIFPSIVFLFSMIIAIIFTPSNK